jgi:mRNA-degrading endonuclease RelE of RelBE toxin-antitoxin system
MAYQVIITPAADKVVKRLPMQIRTRIADHMAHWLTTRVLPEA